MIGAGAGRVSKVPKRELVHPLTAIAAETRQTPAANADFRITFSCIPGTAFRADAPFT
jgi:hypothetical protein